MKRWKVLWAAMLVVAAVLVPLRTVAQADPVTGNATYFDALGSPYGGCGLPQSELDSPHFVALNVFNTPGDYTMYPRPIPDSQASRKGLFDNGRNCGRWVKVTIGDYCNGVNDGAPGQAFCRNGSWVADAYNGGTLNMLIADSCGDPNAWCRDDPYHLDLAKGSLNQFVKDGRTLTDLHPDHWNNRHVSWEFIPAPDYSGDIRIGFLQGSQRWWTAIAVSHLPNGIHGVEYYADGAWHAASMNSDMGQSYIISGLTSGTTDYKIRVRDASDALLNNGRVYSFSLPSACSSQCSAAYTAASYTTESGPTTSPTTATPTPTATTATPTPTGPTIPPGTAARASWAVTSSWNGGYVVTVTVENYGLADIERWKVNWSFPGTQTITNSWGATIAQTGAAVTAANVPYNGHLEPGQSTAFGFVVNGANQPPLDLSTWWGV